MHAGQVEGVPQRRPRLAFIIGRRQAVLRRPGHPAQGVGVRVIGLPLVDFTGQSNQSQNRTCMLFPGTWQCVACDKRASLRAAAQGARACGSIS